VKVGFLENPWIMISPQTYIWVGYGFEDSSTIFNLIKINFVCLVEVRSGVLNSQLLEVKGIISHQITPSYVKIIMQQFSFQV
jgi:hypothetical protein